MSKRKTLFSDVFPKLAEGKVNDEEDPKDLSLNELKSELNKEIWIFFFNLFPGSNSATLIIGEDLLPESEPC